MLAAGFPIRASRSRRPARTTRTPTSRRRSPTASSSTADGLLAFQRDLERRGIADRVLVHVWSEFGRRAKENGSLGTDHGAGGHRLPDRHERHRRHGRRVPGLANGLDDNGNLKATSDFRGIYSGLLEQWLGTDAEGIIPNASRFARPQLIK